MLVQLLDKDQDGVVDAGLVSEVIDYAEGEVDSAIQVAVDLADLVVNTSKPLQQREVRSRSRSCTLEGTGPLRTRSRWR